MIDPVTASPGDSTVPRVTLRAPLRMQGYSRALPAQLLTNSNAANKTVGSLHQIPANSIGVQFELSNYLTGSDTTYQASYAISAGVNDWAIPINASGTPDHTLWVPVTLGGSVDMVVPAAPNRSQVGRVLTDVMRFTTPPLARTDGGQGVLIFFRLCSTTNGITFFGGSGTNGTWNGSHDIQDPMQYSQTYGGGFTWSANIAVAGSLADVSSTRLIAMRHAVAVPHAVLPVLSSPCVTIMSIGDSVLDGQGSRAGKGNAMTVRDQCISGVGFILSRLLDSAKCPVFHINEARSGDTSATFLGNGATSLWHHMPDVVLLQTFSANDGNPPTMAQAWTAYQGAMTLAGAAMAGGARVILVTSPPFAGPMSFRPASTWETVRVAANAWTRASGLPCLDCDLLIGTGFTNPGAYLPMNTEDHVHPNLSGSHALAVAARALLASAYDFSSPPPLTSRPRQFATRLRRRLFGKFSN